MNKLYTEMHKILKPCECPPYKLEYFDIDKKNFGAMLQGISPGKYTRLMRGGEVIMSDTDMEKRTNREFVMNAYGDVLIGGLGIGLILMAIQEKEDIRTITVLEKSKKVIKMIESQLPLNKKTKIIQADVFKWEPSEQVRFNTVYMDIWTCINQKIYYNEMLPLIEKYQQYLDSKDPNKLITCWCEYELSLIHISEPTRPY